MRGVQKGDMESSRKVVFKEDNDITSSPSQSSDKSDSNGGQEATTPSTTAQGPLVSDELGSSNYKYLDANNTWSAHDNYAPPATDIVVSINDGVGVGEEGEEEERDNIEAVVEPEPIPGPKYRKKYQPFFIFPKMEQLEEDDWLHRAALHRAALKGDWKAAKIIFDRKPSAITMKIDLEENTVLHIAAANNHVSFVEKLVERSNSLELAAKNLSGWTALAYAAASLDVVRIAQIMVDKNPGLLNIHGPNTSIPVTLAVDYKRKDMASYLFSKTNFEVLHTSKQLELLIATIATDYYDLTLDILKKTPALAMEREETGDTALHILARKSSGICSTDRILYLKGNRYTCLLGLEGINKKTLRQSVANDVVELIWSYVVGNLSKDELYEFVQYPSSLLHDAARVGNVEFLLILIRSYPSLLWTNDNGKSIFHVAVENRQESVFSLIYDLGGMKDMFVNYVEKKNRFNLLHLAGMVASPKNLNRVSGAALQMQRELLWFKEVEKIVKPSHHEMRCYALQELPTVERIRRDRDDRLTPRELFTNEHKNLRKDGEEWMKNTANSCMLVATLIATVVFAAAFTVPGGNNGNDGTPFFKQNQAFTVFVISDVAALVMSTTSILTFLSILTSRYAEQDFLMSLPLKLLFGLVTLFISIACMVVAFSTTFFLAYYKTKVKIPLVIAAVTILPIGCFCVLHFKLILDIFRSSYWSPRSSLRKHNKTLS